MALFDDASLVVTPNGYKEGTLYSIKPTSGLGDMTVVRATTATRVNSAGLVELVPYNLVEYSQNFGNAAWSKYDVTANTSAIIAPNGNADSYVIAETNTTAVFAFDSSLTTFSANTAYTLSIYAKWDASCTRNVHLRIGNCASSNIGASFDKNGNFVNYTGGSNGTLDSYTSTDVGNGWWRFTVTVTTANVSSVGDCLAIYYLSGTTLNYAGSTTQKINWFGGQLVEGTLPKDYLRTETRLNIPRLDYSNGSCPSLLVEPQRTNLVLYSEQLNNTAWFGTSFITPNTTISPSGILNADTLATTQYNNFWQGISASTSTTYTISLWVKLGTATNLCLVVNNQVSWNSIGGQSFNSANGLNTSTWTRISYTFTTPAVLPLGGINYHIGGNAETGLTQSTGTVFIWGAQLELGSYPTSYIPTTSAAVTRNADAIYKTGISSLIGQTEGVVFIDFVWNQLTGTGSYPRIIELGNNSNNYIQLYSIAGTTTWGWDIYNGGVVQFTGSSTMALGHNKIAIGYKLNDMVIYKNGTLIASDATCTVPATNGLGICGTFDGTAGAQLSASVNLAVLFPTRLTNAELAQLTTI